jgi:hypothetical protein
MTARNGTGTTIKKQNKPLGRGKGTKIKKKTGQIEGVKALQ